MTPSSARAVAGLTSLVLAATLAAATETAATAATSSTSAGGSDAAQVARPALPTPQALKPRSKRKKATRLSVTWPATTLGVDAPAAVTGTVKDSVKGKRKVLIQQRLKTGWYTVGKTKADKAGAFALAVPTYWRYSSKLRVVTPRQGRSPGDNSKAQKITTVLPYAPQGDPSWYTLIGADNGQKLKYRVNPCQTLTYKANFTGAIAGSETDLAFALGQISQATGLRFVDKGATDVVVGAPGKRRDKKTDLIVSWNTPQQTKWPLDENALARGGAMDSRYARSSEKGRIAEVTQMGVTVDNTRPLSDNNKQRNLLMHEIGHAVGLGHAPDGTNQIMNGDGTNYTLPQQWGAGDLVGFSKVDMSQGCIRPVRR